MTEQDEREAQRYCPIHGDLLEGTRSFRCSGAPEGHEFQRQGQITEAMEADSELEQYVQNRVADDRAARDRRVAAEALRSASSLTTDDDYVFRSTDDVRDWLRARADQIENREEAHRG